VGTLETLAGPGFCEGKTVLGNAFKSTGALAVDLSGRIHLDVAPAAGGAAGVIREVDKAVAADLSTNAPAGPDPLASKGSGAPSAGRLAADTDGGVFIADGRAILKLAKQGLSLEPIAGDTSAEPGSSGTGDGGPLLEARFSNAVSLASDEQGNLFVADQTDPRRATFRIRFINRSDAPVVIYPETPQQITVAPGTIQTVAGGQGRGSSATVPALTAGLEGIPPALAVSNNVLYIASYSTSSGAAGRGSERIQSVNLGGKSAVVQGVEIPPGDIATIGGAASTAKGGGPGKRALSYLSGITVVAAGDFYGAEETENRVVKLDIAGRLTVLAGTGQAGARGDGAPARKALLNRPFDVKAGPGGEVYISDGGNGALRVVDAAGVIHRAPGNDTAPQCAVGGRPKTPRQFELDSASPSALAPDRSGNVYFVDARAKTLMKVDRSGAASRVDMGMGAGAPGGGLALSPTGGLYLLEAGGTVAYLNLASKQVKANGVEVPAGAARHITGAAPGGAGPRDEALKSEIGRTGHDSFHLALAADGRGNVFYSYNGAVRQVDPSGTITTIAETDGQADRKGCCTAAAGMAIDPVGNIYLADAPSERVWFINRGSNSITALGQTAPPGRPVPVAGTGNSGISGEGRALDTDLSDPRGIALDPAGNLYISEGGTQSVRKVDAGGMLSTVAGIGEPGFNGDGYRAQFSSLNSPFGLAVDRCGNLLIADTGNGRIRRLNLTQRC